LFAFTHFDAARIGTLLVRDVETLLLSLGLCLSRSQIGRQLRQIGPASLKQDTIHYRKYTDAQVVKETFESRHEPLLMPYTVDDLMALARDNMHVLGVPFAALPTTFWGSTQQQGNTAAGGTVAPANTAVVYEGSVVDIRQTMQLLSRLQQQVNEQTQAQVALTSELNSVKEVRDTLTKRKKRLEDDLDRYKKKLSSAETSVKTLESSERELKSAVQDVKKLGERIIYTADKVMPPPAPPKKASVVGAKKEESPKKTAAGGDAKSVKPENGESSAAGGDVDEKKAAGAHAVTANGVADENSMDCSESSTMGGAVLQTGMAETAADE